MSRNWFKFISNTVPHSCSTSCLLFDDALIREQRRARSDRASCCENETQNCTVCFTLKSVATGHTVTSSSKRSARGKTLMSVIQLLCHNELYLLDVTYSVCACVSVHLLLSARLSLGSVSHWVSHGSSGFTGSAFLERQPAGVRSPVGVWSAQPHRALSVQVSPADHLPLPLDPSPRHAEHCTTSVWAGKLVTREQRLIFQGWYDY